MLHVCHVQVLGDMFGFGQLLHGGAMEKWGYVSFSVNVGAPSSKLTPTFASGPITVKG